MCEHDTNPPPLPAYLTKKQLAADPAPVSGSRRRRLWDLPHQYHCPIVGVCLPLDTLRKLVNKAMTGKAMADDYEVHVAAVSECVLRNRLSELLQLELESRYLSDIQSFKLAKTAEALFDRWVLAVDQGDVPGAFWAALTHPRCDASMQEVLCRDMHMLQHQAGASARVDLAKFNGVIKENGVLTRELGKVQERSTRLLAEKASEIELLGKQMVQLRADNLSKESLAAFLTQDLESMRASIPEFDALGRSQKKIEQMTARQADLEQQNAALKERVASLSRIVETQKNQPANTSATLAAEVPASSAMPFATVKLHLNQKTVLCVGGRSGNVANYRDVIERVGGRFAHHDGGQEDNANILDASLAAADLVICQTGCISHNAYWRVKDFCKRTGKRCVFVENPSASSLARGLEQMAEEVSATSA